MCSAFFGTVTLVSSKPCVRVNNKDVYSFLINSTNILNEYTIYVLELVILCLFQL